MNIQNKTSKRKLYRARKLKEKEKKTARERVHMQAIFSSQKRRA